MPNAVLQRLVSERETTLDQIDQILSHAETEERDPSSSEMELVTRSRARIGELEPLVTELLEVEETRARSAGTRAALLRAAPPRGGEAPAERGEATTGAAEGPYETFAQYARDQIITRIDRVGALVGSEMRQRAAGRLERAVANTITTDVAGLILPQHLAQIFDVIDKARPIVAASRSVGLTSGKLTWPSITQRPTVGKQAAEKTETVSTKMTVAMLETVADTYLGSGDLSWQTIQWASPDALALWFDLAAEAYAEQTEIAAAVDLLAGATIPPVVIATDDLAGWTTAVAEAAGAIRSTSKARANGIAMDVATGYHLLGLVSEASPVFVTVGPGSLGAGTGNIAGLSFIISDVLNAGTAIVGDFTKLLVAETAGAPVEMRAVEPSIAGLEVGVVGAFASAVVLAGSFAPLTVPTVP